MKYFKLVLVCLIIGCTSSVLAQNHLANVVEHSEEVRYLISLLEEDLTEKRKQEFYKMFPEADKKLPNKRQKESKSEIYYELETSGYEVKYFKITQPKQKKEQLTFFGKSTYSEIKNALCESENFVCPTSNQNTYINSIDLKLSRLVILQFDPKTGLLNHIEYSGSRAFQNKFSDGLPSELCSYTPTIDPKNLELNTSGICLEGNCKSWKGTMQYGNLVFKGILKNGIPNGYGYIYFVDGCKWFNIQDKPSEYIEVEFKNGIAEGAFRFKTDRFEGVPKEWIEYENGKPSMLVRVKNSSNGVYGYKSKINSDFIRNDDSAIVDIPNLGEARVQFKDDQLIVPDSIYTFQKFDKLVYKGRIDDKLGRAGYGQYLVDHSDLILTSYFKDNKVVEDSLTTLRNPGAVHDMARGYLYTNPAKVIKLKNAEGFIGKAGLDGFQRIRAEKLQIQKQEFIPLGRVEIDTLANNQWVHNKNYFGVYDEQGYFLVGQGTNFFKRPVNTVLSRGEYKDPRDGKTYQTATLMTDKGKSATIFTQNIAYRGIPNQSRATLWGEDYYNRRALSSICPPGWRIPSSNDIISIIKPFSEYSKKGAKINFYPEPSLEYLKLNLTSVGYYSVNDNIASENEVKLYDEFTLIWISDTEPGYYGIMSIQPGSSDEVTLAYRRNWKGYTDYLTCRCFKDGTL